MTMHTRTLGPGWQVSAIGKSVGLSETSAATIRSAHAVHLPSGCVLAGRPKDSAW